MPISLVKVQFVSPEVKNENGLTTRHEATYEVEFEYDSDKHIPAALFFTREASEKILGYFYDTRETTSTLGEGSPLIGLPTSDEVGAPLSTQNTYHSKKLLQEYWKKYADAANSVNVYPPVLLKCSDCKCKPSSKVELR